MECSHSSLYFFSISSLNEIRYCVSGYLLYWFSSLAVCELTSQSKPAAHSRASIMPATNVLHYRFSCSGTYLRMTGELSRITYRFLP
jgi:hypothetical protein